MAAVSSVKFNGKPKPKTPVTSTLVDITVSQDEALLNRPLDSGMYEEYSRLHCSF